MKIDRTMFDAFPTRIETARLVIRVVQERDLPDLFDVHSDDEVTRFLPYETWRTMDDAHAWYARMTNLQAEGKSHQLVVIENATGRVIGTAVLFNVDAVSARAEVGYALGKRWWGKGHMREALEALIGCAFDKIELRRIEAFADLRNAASDRLLLDLGFTCEGTMRQRVVMKGEIKDSSVYGLLRSEWPSAAPSQAT